MDYPTARQLLITQGTPPTSNANPDQFLLRLAQGQSPIPGQVTSLLLALKVVFDALQSADSFDRPLVNALYCLAFDSRQYYEAAQRQGVEWPPLLDEDITRIQRAVKSIFAGTWS